MRTTKSVLCSLMVAAVSLAIHAEAAAQTACQVDGDVVPPSGTELFDARTGGSAVAQLTGAKLPLRLSDFGPNPASGRVKVQTSSGKGSVRIDGWADVSRFRFFAAKDIPVVDSHVWITRGQEVKLAGLVDGKLTVVRKVLGTTDQTVNAEVACDQITLTVAEPYDFDAPERARTYQMKNDRLELYDESRGERVFTLQMQAEARKVFWGVENKAGYVHVMSKGDISLDAWVRYGDLTPLYHQELVGLRAIAPSPLAAKKLALQDPPAVKTADKELKIFASYKKDAAVIGVVEVGAKFFPMEISGEFTNIIPEALGVMPTDGNGFWVKLK